MRTNLAKVKPTNCNFLRNALPLIPSWNPNYKLVKVALAFSKLSWAFASWLGLIITMLMLVMLFLKGQEKATKSMSSQYFGSSKLHFHLATQQSLYYSFDS